MSPVQPNTRPSPGALGAFVALYTLLLLLLDQALRQVPLLDWLVAVVLPVLVLPRLRRNPYLTLFGWLKTYSVLAAILVITLLRHGGAPQAGPWLVVLIFGANIGEALGSALLRRQFASALAGAALLLTLPGPSHLRLEGAPLPDLLYALPPIWLLGYTAWNWHFIRGRTPHLAGLHTAVLLAPLLAELWTPGSWGQSRAFTLGLHQLLHTTCWPLFEAYYLEAPTFPGVALAAGRAPPA